MESRHRRFTGNPQSQVRSVAQWTGWQCCPPFPAACGLRASKAVRASAFAQCIAFTGGHHEDLKVFGKRLQPNRGSAEGAGP